MHVLSRLCKSPNGVHFVPIIIPAYSAGRDCCSPHAEHLIFNLGKRKGKINFEREKKTHSRSINAEASGINSFLSPPLQYSSPMLYHGMDASARLLSRGRNQEKTRIKSQGCNAIDIPDDSWKEPFCRAAMALGTPAGTFQADGVCPSWG
jgi:hypothetical protein